MSKVFDHVHKYERRNFGWPKAKSYPVYKCAIAGCTHYMIDLEAVIGRYSQCWGYPDGEPCPNEVEMTRYIVFSERRKRPLCDSCKEDRKIKRLEKEVEDAIYKRATLSERP
jgi:hypothetical protein